VVIDDDEEEEDEHTEEAAYGDIMFGEGAGVARRGR
jgi:hypothetical protein